MRRARCFRRAWPIRRCSLGEQVKGGPRCGSCRRLASGHGRRRSAGVRAVKDGQEDHREEQLKAVGARLHDPVRQMEFIRWQVLRAATPLREPAQNREVGPAPLAAGHAATRLHMDAVAASNVTTLAAQSGQPEAARDPAERDGRHRTAVSMLKSAGLRHLRDLWTVR
ncbi:DUF6245 family protein [Streptomyces globisporus]|uniref:DUF6245 family protein n=1 Tax=Streptomyces globisporus TaxID=1908 RepID=UPI0037BD033A